MVGSIIPDEYERRARLYPVLLLSLPTAFAVACWFPQFSWSQLIGGLALPLVFTFLSQIGRDQGRKREPWLYQHWGGKPSTVVLQHRSNHLPPQARERYHKRLEELLPGTRMPNRLSEGVDPTEADQIYDSCVHFLRERTRDKAAFPLVFAENVNYGMRRNMWGMKPAAIVLCVVGLIASTLATILKYDGQLPAVPAIATVLNAAMLAFWLLRITPDWVRVPAFAYAERLLSACDSLTPAPAPRPSGVPTE